MSRIPKPVGRPTNCHTKKHRDKTKEDKRKQKLVACAAEARGSDISDRESGYGETLYAHSSDQHLSQEQLPPTSALLPSNAGAIWSSSGSSDEDDARVLSAIFEADSAMQRLMRSSANSTQAASDALAQNVDELLREGRLRVIDATENEQPVRVLLLDQHQTSSLTDSIKRALKQPQHSTTQQSQQDVMRDASHTSGDEDEERVEAQLLPVKVFHESEFSGNDDAATYSSSEASVTCDDDDAHSLASASSVRCSRVGVEVLEHDTEVTRSVLTADTHFSDSLDGSERDVTAHSDDAHTSSAAEEERSWQSDMSEREKMSGSNASIDAETQTLRHRTTQTLDPPPQWRRQLPRVPTQQLHDDSDETPSDDETESGSGSEDTENDEATAHITSLLRQLSIRPKTTARRPPPKSRSAQFAKRLDVSSSRTEAPPFQSLLNLEQPSLVESEYLDLEVSHPPADLCDDITQSAPAFVNSSESSTQDTRQQMTSQFVGGNPLTRSRVRLSDEEADRYASQLTQPRQQQQPSHTDQDNVQVSHDSQQDKMTKHPIRIQLDESGTRFQNGVLTLSDSFVMQAAGAPSVTESRGTGVTREFSTQTFGQRLERVENAEATAQTELVLRQDFSNQTEFSPRHITPQIPVVEGVTSPRESCSTDDIFSQSRRNMRRLNTRSKQRAPVPKYGDGHAHAEPGSRKDILRFMLMQVRGLRKQMDDSQPQTPKAASKNKKPTATVAPAVPTAATAACVGKDVANRHLQTIYDELDVARRRLALLYDPINQSEREKKEERESKEVEPRREARKQKQKRRKKEVTSTEDSTGSDGSFRSESRSPPLRTRTPREEGRRLSHPYPPSFAPPFATPFAPPTFYAPPTFNQTLFLHDVMFPPQNRLHPQKVFPLHPAVRHLSSFPQQPKPAHQLPVPQTPNFSPFNPATHPIQRPQQPSQTQRPQQPSQTQRPQEKMLAQKSRPPKYFVVDSSRPSPSKPTNQNRQEERNFHSQLLLAKQAADELKDLTLSLELSNAHLDLDAL